MPNLEEQRNCFFISEFGCPDSPERKKSDKIFNEIVVPVCKYYNFEPIRADKDYYSTQLIKNMGEHISNDELVIADVSKDNPNVMYELGARHALQKPSILIRERTTEEIPFDIRSVGIIDYDMNDFMLLKEELRRAIAHFEEYPNDFVTSFVPSTGLIELIEGEMNVLKHIGNHKQYSGQHLYAIWCINEYDKEGLEKYFDEEKSYPIPSTKVRLINTNIIDKAMIVSHINRFKDEIIRGSYVVYSTNHKGFEIMIFGQVLEKKIPKEIASILIPDDIAGLTTLAISSENKTFVGQLRAIFGNLRNEGRRLTLRSDDIEKEVDSWIKGS